MYSFRDKSKEAKKYWLHQGIANNRISGLDIPPEDIAMLESWIDEEVPQDEQVRRLVRRGTSTLNAHLDMLSGWPTQSTGLKVSKATIP